MTLAQASDTTRARFRTSVSLNPASAAPSLSHARPRLSSAGLLWITSSACKAALPESEAASRRLGPSCSRPERGGGLGGGARDREHAAEASQIEDLLDLRWNGREPHIALTDPDPFVEPDHRRRSEERRVGKR